MKKVGLSFIVLLLVGAMFLFGCSNNNVQTEIKGNEVTNQETVKTVESNVPALSNIKNSVLGNGFGTLNSKLVDIYNQNSGNSKFDKYGRLWVKITEDGKELFQYYITENEYDELIYDVSIGKYSYTLKDKDSAGDFEFNLEAYQFNDFKEKYNALIDSYEMLKNNNCVVENNPNVEIVTSSIRESEIQAQVSKLNKKELSREKDYLRYRQLNNIFSKICGASEIGDWYYLELSNNFKSKYSESKGILNYFNLGTFLGANVLSDNVVNVSYSNNDSISPNGKDASFNFLINFEYDNQNNINDIIDIKCMLPNPMHDGGWGLLDMNSRDYETTLELLSGKELYQNDGANYNNVITTDKFWKTYNPQRGILDIDKSNLLVDEYGDMSSSSIQVVESNYEKRYAKIKVTYKDGNSETYSVNWKCKEFNLIDEVEVIKDSDEYSFNNGQFFLNGELQKSKWIYYGGYWYYVDEQGNITTNKWINGKFVDNEGKKVVSRTTPDGKYVDEFGDVVDNLYKDLVDTIKTKDIDLNAWYKTKSGLWYYFENDRTTTKKGWFTDSRDDQTYYLNPENGIMAVGWTTIDGEEYYFNESHDNEPNWYEVGDGIYESYGKKVKAYGSMYRDEETPDGKRVDADGKLVN